MANIWLTRDEMLSDSAILPASFTAKYLNDNNEYIDCVYNKNDVLQNRVGVNDTTCDMSFWQNGDNGTNNRFIAQYLATNITNLPASAGNRRISVEIPVYMRNVKYLDICFCVWIDLGFAYNTSLSSYNDVSFYIYNKNGERLQGYCIPTAGNDHPGTGRLSIQGSPGFIPFRFLYDDEENPADIDFISLEFSGAYSEQNQLNIWISQPCYNEDIEFVEEPQPEQQGGNWGDDTDKSGGDGTFTAPSDNDGDRNGTTLLSDISTANTTFKTVLGGNYNLYYVPAADLTKILAVLYSSDYFQRFVNSMYNPLSAVLNCALIPEIFCSYSASVSDMTAGGYNISQNIFPNPVQFASPEPLIMRHIGDIDIPKYFGAFPDFAPYTQCKLHLPYIGEIEIDINKIADGTLSVDYVCDTMSGNVTAWIWCNDKDGNHTYCYNATGNCAYSVPLFANSSDGSAIGKIIGGVASIAAGNVFSGIASTASGAASAVSRHTQISGTFSGNIGLTTNPKCFAEFSRPQWANPANYQAQSGIPSEISGKLSDFCGGFVQVETIDLQNVPATEAELAEIESLLESGIYYVSN